MEEGWEQVLLGLIASTGLDECVGVRRIEELSGCSHLCAICEELMLQLGLLTKDELQEVKQHDNIKGPERLKIYLEVFESEAGYEPFVDCGTTVEAICEGSEERLMDLCAWIFEKYEPGEAAAAREPTTPTGASSEGRKVLSEASGNSRLGASPAAAEAERPPLKVSLKLASLDLEDPDLELAMYPVENEANRLKFLLGGAISPRRSASPTEDGSASSSDRQEPSAAGNLALFAWNHDPKLTSVPAADLRGLGIEENSSRALHKHLTSWMRRLGAQQDEEEKDTGAAAMIADATQFRDGVILCRLIQQITGKRILGGIQVDGDKYESVSNISRGFQSLWSYLLHKGLNEFKQGFVFYPECLVKGNESSLWSCIHFLYKLYLHSKGGSGSTSVSRSTSVSSTSNIPQNMVTFQSVFDKILGMGLDELKQVTLPWLETMPLIGTKGATKKDNKDIKNGSVLCQLMTLYDKSGLHSTPILDPKHKTYARDNICVGLMALEQVLMERIGKSHVSKLVGGLTVDRISQGDQSAALKTLAVMKFCFEWRNGTFTKTSFNPSLTQKQKQAKSATKGNSEAEKKAIKWLSELELVEKDKTFSHVLQRLKQGVLFIALAEKATKKKLFPMISESARAKEVRVGSMKRIFNSLARIPELSKYLSPLSMQPKLLSGDKAAWLSLLEGLHRFQKSSEAKAKSRKPTSAAIYTRLGQRIKPESTKVEPKIGMGVTTRDFQNLMGWIKSKIYVPRTILLGDFFRDGRQIARLLQILGRKQLTGVNWSSGSYSAITQNLESIMKFLGERGVEVAEYNLHSIASGDEEMITDLLWRIKEWHRQSQRKKGDDR